MKTGLLAGALLASLILTAGAVRAQDDSSGSSDSSNGMSGNFNPPSNLQPTYTPIGAANSNNPMRPPMPQGVAPSTLNGVTILVFEDRDGDRHEYYERHRVGEVFHGDRHELRQGEENVARGAAEENRGVRLVAQGEKEGGANGARLEAEGRALERRGAHEIRRGVHEERRAFHESSHGTSRAVHRSGWEQRREARQAARQSSGGSHWSSGRVSGSSHGSRSSGSSDKWHHL